MLLRNNASELKNYTKTTETQRKASSKVMHDLTVVQKDTLDYFGADELAANVWITKYALKNKEGKFLEKSPDDMHKRLAKEFARIERKFGGDNQLSKKAIYNLLKDFKYIVPQGSPMMGIGNNHVNVSLSNCVVVDSPQDNISSIFFFGR